VSSKNVFEHISYTSFQIQRSPGKVIKKEINCAHRLKKIRGNVDIDSVE